MSKRTRGEKPAPAKREKVAPEAYGDKVFTLLHAIDDEEDQYVGQKVPEITKGLVTVLSEIEQSADDDSDNALKSLVRFTDALHQELVSDEIRRLERHLVKSDLFQNLMITWLQLAGTLGKSGAERDEHVKKLHSVHFELSKRGVEVFEMVLESLGEKPDPAAKAAAAAARASAGVEDVDTDTNSEADEEGAEEDEDEDDDFDEEDAEAGEESGDDAAPSGSDAEDD